MREYTRGEKRRFLCDSLLRPKVNMNDFHKHLSWFIPFLGFSCYIQYITVEGTDHKQQAQAISSPIPIPASSTSHLLV